MIVVGVSWVSGLPTQAFVTSGTQCETGCAEAISGGGLEELRGFGLNRSSSSPKRCMSWRISAGTWHGFGL